MTRNEFVRKVSKKYGYSQDVVRAWLVAFTETMGEVLASGDTLKLPNFGTFVQRITPPKVGRNRYTGERIDIPAKRKVSFQMSGTIKDQLAEVPFEYVPPAEANEEDANEEAEAGQDEETT